MSAADRIFIENCRRILLEGEREDPKGVRARWEDGSPATTRRLFGLCNRYNLAEEFPILTLRRTAFKNAVDELLWIWQKKSNNVRDLNSHIWDSWADEEGSIGKAYGYQLGKVSHYADGDYDQVDRVRRDLRLNPASRRILTNIYNHEDLHEMHLYPCAWSVTFNVNKGRLHAILNQRSQDMLVANNWNVVQYAALLHALAKEADLLPGELIHVISDAHIYERHIPLVEELLTREEKPAPAFHIRGEKIDFYALTPEDFVLENYEHGGTMKKIPVAI